MKKILIPILLIISLSTQAQQLVNLGSGPNMRDGDPIRTAFQKHNNNVTDLYATKASINNQTFTGVTTFAEEGIRIGLVTITANGTELNILDGALVSTTELNYLVGVTSGVQSQLNAKLPINNPQATGVLRIGTDTAATRAYARSVSGGTVDPAAVGQQISDSIAAGLNYDNLIDSTLMAGQSFDDLIDSVIAAGSFGGSGSYNPTYLQFIVGSTAGAPGNGDTLLTHSGFVNKFVALYRGSGANMTRQRYNSGSTNTINGYRINSSTGTITVKPAFSTGETVLAEPINSSVTWLTFSGGGTSLQNGLIASWDFDETTGSTLADNVGSNDATVNGAVINQAGQFGRSVLFNDWTDYLEVANDSSLHPTTALTVSLWFKLNSIPNTSENKNYYLIRHSYNDDQPWSWEIFISKNNGYISWYVKNSSDADFQAETNTGLLSINTWYNLICTIQTGETGKIYLNNVDRTFYTDGGNFTGNIRAANENLYIGNTNPEDGYGTNGYIDAVNIYNRVITADERQALLTSTPY